jgi:hypothetical protein
VEPLLVTFVGGREGLWRVERQTAIRGEGLPAADRMAVLEGDGVAQPDACSWAVLGATSNARYVTRAERDELERRQAPLLRPEATSAALIPIRKSAECWALAQDERRAIFEESSQHVATGLRYLPAVARRLHHARELGEPFDFLTWFEFAPEHTNAFDELVGMLRETEEWRYVVREVDVRLSRD